MARPSDPLLAWLRNKLDEKGMKTATLAEATSLPRARLRKVLTGSDAMLVDELLAITRALELSPAELASAGELPESAPPTLRVAEADDGDESPRVDPWGNQPRQLFEIAFALGCDFFFVVDGTQLEGSKLPASVLTQYRGKDVPIKLDAAYHKHNNPRYEEAGIRLALSFDALYECHFPWSAIKQVIFFPLAPEPDEPADTPPAQSGPLLRLVT